MAVTLLSWPAAGQQSAPLTGVPYATNWGDVTFMSEGSHLVGTYRTDGGRLVGTLQGRILSGYWTETESARACGSDRDGRVHWGRLELRFNTDFSLFSGPWGYCDGLSDGDWTGKLVDPAQAGPCGAAIGKRDRLAQGLGDLMEQRLPEERLRELARILTQIRESITTTQADTDAVAERINEVADDTEGLAEGVAGILRRIAAGSVEMMDLVEEVTEVIDTIVPELESWADRLERAETSSAADTVHELRAWFDELRERLPIDDVPGLGTLLDQYSAAIERAAEDVERWEGRVRVFDDTFREVTGRHLYVAARPLRSQLADARLAAMAALEQADEEVEKGDCEALPADPTLCERPHAHIDRVLAAAIQATTIERTRLADMRRVHARLRADAAAAWDTHFVRENAIVALDAQLAGADAATRGRITGEIAALEAETARLRANFSQLSEAARTWGQDVRRLEAELHAEVERELAKTRFTQNDLLYLAHCLDQRYVPRE